MDSVHFLLSDGLFASQQCHGYKLLKENKLSISIQLSPIFFKVHTLLLHHVTFEQQRTHSMNVIAKCAGQQDTVV